MDFATTLVFRTIYTYSRMYINALDACLIPGNCCAVLTEAKVQCNLHQLSCFNEMVSRKYQTQEDLSPFF